MRALEPSPVLAGFLATWPPAITGDVLTVAHEALDALVEAEQLATAAPNDPALRDVASSLEALFLHAFDTVLRAARLCRRPS